MRFPNLSVYGKIRPMKTDVPSAHDVSARLRALKLAELGVLSRQSGVPFPTLVKIRMGTTPNPGIETVRKFFHLLPAQATSVPDTQASEQQQAA